MVLHHTKSKGDLAVAKVIADVTEKGYSVLSPLSEHLPFDLAVYHNGGFYRIQVKYAAKGNVFSKTSWTDKRGRHIKPYKEEDFDYYAIYLPDKNVVCYPSIKFKGITLRTTAPNSATPFFWYEDFLNFTTKAEKRSFRDFGVSLTHSNSSAPRPSTRKVNRPSKEELTHLLWSKPMKELAKDFGVSDKAISKWAKWYGIKTPDRGHWVKKIV